MPTDQSSDLSTLLAECEQAHQRMTPGPWWLGPGPHFRVYMNDRDATPLHESWFGHDVYGIVTLVNAYPALRDALHAHQFCHLAGLFDPTGVKLGMLKRAVEDKDAKITRLRDELNTTRPYRELWEASETERNVVERERDRLRSLIARTVVVMDGSWDMLPPHEQDRLAEELRGAALTDAPAPPRTG